MSQRVNTLFKKELKHFGKHDEWKDCFHCGNCTAVCSLTNENTTFPRKSIRLTQLGLKESLTKSVDPWLCYYCGDCSESCPRDANPGELMMTLRRYLTSVYDWTGISRLFYKSHKWELGFIFGIAAIIIALFAIFLPPLQGIFSNPQAFLNQDGGVMINNLTANYSGAGFVKVIEYADWTMAFIVAFLLVSNILNMYRKVVLNNGNKRVPLYAYITEAWQLAWNFATQAKFSKCDKKSYSYWFGHLLLMTGYSIMFAVIVVMLPKFQIEEVVPWYNWQRLLGYYATFGILFFLSIVTIQRLRKTDMKTKFSHPSDWIFIIMLALTTITGILIHIFRIAGLPVATYFMYVFHLAVLFPMILIEVPFSKWSHLAYRPFAIYFNRLKKHAYQRKTEPEVEFAI
jgi:quinone-modifying oxidoreductase subunit QmoC